MYGTVQGYTEYADENGLPAPGADFLKKLAIASNFIDGYYGPRFPGQPTNGLEQDNEWPRKNAKDRYGNRIDPAITPKRVEYAAYQAAALEQTTPGQLTPVVIAAQQVVKERVEGAVEVQYSDKVSGAAAQVPQITIIDGILAPLLTAENIPAAFVV